MYEFKIVQGEKHVVLQNDTIPKGGKVQLTIPERYKGYKGMAMWYAKRAYPTSHELYPIFEKEYDRILMDYSNYIIKVYG